MIGIIKSFYINGIIYDDVVKLAKKKGLTTNNMINVLLEKAISAEAQIK